MAKTLTIAQLQDQLEMKTRELDKLKDKREKVAAQLADIDREIQKMTGESAVAATRRSAPAGGSRKTAKRPRRRRGQGALVDYIRQVLSENPKGMRAVEIAQAVKDAGYESRSKDFYTIVAAALRDESQFQRVRRGVYKLK
jgi:chromosome segregation ATPase